MEEETKDSLIKEKPSEDAIRLAQVLYNTYLQVDDPYMCVPITRLCQVFKAECNTEFLTYLGKLFEELNEPVIAEHFNYRGKKYEWKVMKFCAVEQLRGDRGNYLDINLNEMFIEAVKDSDEDPFFVS
ncbi:MAG: hypothetical protein DRG24_02445 [Epsilonproteobacteria bacterium]|nr:MAG: hypothetical protein DRG24_02445 [Campylobacterota bacterium]